MTRRRDDERGFALIGAMSLLMIMFIGAVALASLTDVQAGQSAEQRQRETAFNMAESVMNAEVYALARDWPGRGNAGGPYPDCTPALVSPRCPANAQLLAGVPSNDAVGATWSSLVRDNGSAQTAKFYRDDLVTAQPGYDANGDGYVWVRASATASGHTRTLVALVRAQLQAEELPHAAIIAGRLDISNNGNKIIVDATGGAGAVAVRCTPSLLDLTPCLGHTFGGGRYQTLGELVSFLGTQIAGVAAQSGYTGGPAMSAASRERLRARAVADGTYYATCPSSLTGQIVYIESGSCSYTGNSAYNSAAQPGLVILASGSLYLGGTVVFDGVIYHANTTNRSDDIVQLQGNAQAIGGILVDGPGTVVAGSAKLNLQLDLGAYEAVSSYGSAGVLQNTWRELGA